MRTVVIRGFYEGGNELESGNSTKYAHICAHAQRMRLEHGDKVYLQVWGIGQSVWTHLR